MMWILPQYTHIVNPKLKHIYLTLDKMGNLLVKSPVVSQYRIEQLLLKKASWINTSKKRFLEKKGKEIDFCNNPKIYFMGKLYPLLLIPHAKKNIQLELDDTVIKLYYSTYDESAFGSRIDLFYKKEAEKYIPACVNKWAEIMSLSPQSIRFRKTKRQWGSCSAKNVLCFNTMIMKLPLPVMQYIIVHELAHIKHKHHQKDFWDLVQSYLPNYKAQVNELKCYSTY